MTLWTAPRFQTFGGLIVTGPSAATSAVTALIECCESPFLTSNRGRVHRRWLPLKKWIREPSGCRCGAWPRSHWWRSSCCWSSPLCSSAPWATHDTAWVTIIPIWPCGGFLSRQDGLDQAQFHNSNNNTADTYCGLCAKSLISSSMGCNHDHSHFTDVVTEVKGALWLIWGCSIDLSACKSRSLALLYPHFCVQCSQCWLLHPILQPCTLTRLS